MPAIQIQTKTLRRRAAVRQARANSAEASTILISADRDDYITRAAQSSLRIADVTDWCAHK